jgi:hypothetical protein
VAVDLDSASAGACLVSCIVSVTQCHSETFAIYISFVLGKKVGDAVGVLGNAYVLYDGVYIL